MSAENTQDFENLQEKFDRFRILIVGRANAGKTTILRGICNSTEDPEIYDGDGNKVDPSKVEGSMGRGIHNIENELIFRSNEKLVFHDSQGFEAGRADEFLQMKKFIADRAKTTFLKKRIHAIWYCIPMDKLDRAIQCSEEMFFDECDPGNVPVVVLFTKFDALLAVALGKLAPADRQLPLQDRLSKAKLLIEEIFNRADAWGRLSQMKHAPKSCVKIGGMHKSNEGCSQLLEVTTIALNEEVLQMLLISAQEVNIALCVKYAVRQYCIPMDKLHRAIQRSEEMFFDECDPGNVPVVVLFTKFDALRTVALGQLAPADRQLPLQDRLSKAEPLIEEIFNRANAWGRLSQMKHAPKSYVKIGGMHKSNEGCNQVLEATTTALDEEVLQMLLISAQEVNIALCVRYAVRQ
ncbi:hypothetical protein OG21DRAFT_1489936 [Imleria badia]|nr:hypothetical protein OG21DRAFT_1489936 [Imleria badia]